MKPERTLPVFLALLLVAGAARAERLKESFDKTFPLKPGATVELQSGNGAMVVEAWDRDEVRITAEKWAESRISKEAKKALGQIRIETSQTEEGLKVWTRLPEPGLMSWLQGRTARTGATYRIRVPRQVMVIAESSNGDITLAGTRGKAILESSNGSIVVSGVQGKMNLVTFNGDIKVRVPASYRMTLDAAAPNGEIRSDFPVSGASPKKKDVLQGTVNGGGEKVLIRSFNGAVQISRL